MATSSANANYAALCQKYESLLAADKTLSMPIAAIQALATELIQPSRAQTMSELIKELQAASQALQEASWSPISPGAGTALLLRFVTLQRPPLGQSFDVHKENLAREALQFVRSSKLCATKIVQEASHFVKDESVIMTHSYSRVVTQTLLHAASTLRKRFSVYVTEARPYGQGIKTHDILTRAGIPCTLVLDSAAAVAMGKCDSVMVGAEGVAESGGVINAIGSWSLSLAAKAYNKPVYVLAESFKFLRLFPLSQFDLPTPQPILQFAEPYESSQSTTTPSLAFEDEQEDAPGPMEGDHLSSQLPTPNRLMKQSQHPSPLSLTLEQVDQNPLLDYTEPEYIRAIVSDVGVLTPSAVADTLLGIYGGA